MPSKYYKSGWTLERRERQREAIQNWKPWEKSTGPRSEKGRAQSAINARAGHLTRKLAKLSVVDMMKLMRRM